MGKNKKRKPTQAKQNAARERRLDRNAAKASAPKMDMEKIGGAVKKFTEIIQEAQAKAKDRPIQNPNAKPSMGGQLTKPDSQRVLDDRLEWIWDVTAARVIAIFYKNTGNWQIQTVFPNGIGRDVCNFDQGGAQAFAEAILSAIVWEHNWKSFVGEYLDDRGPTEDRVLLDEANRLREPQVGVVFDPSPSPLESPFVCSCGEVRMNSTEFFPAVIKEVNHRLDGPCHIAGIAGTPPRDMKPNPMDVFGPIIHTGPGQDPRAIQLPDVAIVDNDKPKRAPWCKGPSMNEPDDFGGSMVDTRIPNEPRCVMCGRDDVFFPDSTDMRRHEYRRVPGYSAPK